jgi:GTP-binding protein
MPGLVRKPVLVAANKMDEPNAAENLKLFQQNFKGEIFQMSCLTEDGLEPMKQALLKEVLEIRQAEAELEAES